MSRDWDDDEPQPRRRRRRYDDDDDYRSVRRRRGARSGSVTGVGVLTIIVGSLVLLCGLCFIFAGLMAAGGPFRGIPGLELAAGVLVVIAVLFLAIGVLYLVGGIGCVSRRNWGRIMTLVMAGISAVLGILQIINVIVQLAGTRQIGPGPPGFREGQIIGILFAIVLIILLFTHCVMSFVVLLNYDNAQEFE